MIAVERKAREPFGELVRDWNTGEGKAERLADLCARLGLDPAEVGGLRYQLLHRTVSALLEAARCGASEALMLVHSFDATDASFGDYRAFATALGLSGAEPNAITSPVALAGRTLRLGWVRGL